MSIDIFSLKAFENISKWIGGWSREWHNGLENVKDKSKIPTLKHGKARFIGYVTQQYLAKKDASGQRRAVLAYEQIRKQIDGLIDAHDLSSDISGMKYEIGTVPNLFSLIPMSQSQHTPVFQLSASDGVVGAHFAKVRDAKEIFGKVASEVMRRAH
ncbi:hypothetical protein D3C80_1576510 [compost metagenome]